MPLCGFTIGSIEYWQTTEFFFRIERFAISKKAKNPLNRKKKQTTEWKIATLRVNPLTKEKLIKQVTVVVGMQSLRNNTDKHNLEKRNPTSERIKPKKRLFPFKENLRE